ncbi:MAG: hypothetical protein PWP76_576 [Candidatus Diapherotrites archaeon]|nr:hypothetical protein [Candidatus Diapherotrites archaeon]MDN5367154.1 hypothetical protein [Candidatus Diapherotrites archaeon]
MNIFKGPLEEVEDFERKLAKKYVHIAERNYEEKIRREVAIFVLKHLAAMARDCEENVKDLKLGRIGRPL